MSEIANQPWLYGYRFSMRSHSSNLPGNRFPALLERHEGRNILIVPKDQSPSLEPGSTTSGWFDVSETPAGSASSTAALLGAKALASGINSRQTVLVYREDEQDEQPINVDEYEVMDLEKDPEFIETVASMTSEDVSEEARQIARDNYIWVTHGPSTTVPHHQSDPPSGLTFKTTK